MFQCSLHPSFRTDLPPAMWAPYLSQQPVLLAWHLCLCSAVIVDLYFDSMHLRILLMCVFLFVYTCTPLVVCVRAFFSACVCVCIANRSYWLVVKPRSLRVFMSEEAEQLGGIFLSLKQNDSLDSPSPLWQPLLSKETHFPESTVLPPIF